MTDTDRTPTVEQQATDGTRQDATVTVQEAARRLEVSTDAVRSRLRRGTLKGHKQGDEWRVHLPASTRASVGRQDTDGAQQDATGNRQDATVDSNRTRQDVPSAVDVTPLVDHIAQLEEKVERLTEASTMWQIRARQAEERLMQLTAGETEPDAPTMAPGSSESDAPAPPGIRTWLRRLWGGEEGCR